MNIPITYAKGIAIILMVFAHGGCPNELERFIAMFHMPLFFFFSGYCFKETYLGAPVEFVKKRVKGLYVPFIKWGLIILILHNAFYYIGIYSIDSGYNNYVYTWNDYWWRAVNILKFKYAEQLLGGYWFLPALFFGGVISWGCIRIFRRYILIGAIMMLVVGYGLGLLFSHHLHTFGLCEKWFAVAFLFIMGHYFAKKNLKPFTLWQSFIAIGLVVIGSIFWPHSMPADYYCTWEIFPYMGTAILGTWSVYSWCNMIEGCNSMFQKTLRYIGENTLTILTWHFLSFKIVSLLVVLIYGLPFSYIGMHPVISDYTHMGWFVVYTIVGILVPLSPMLIKHYYGKRI